MVPTPDLLHLKFRKWSPEIIFTNLGAILMCAGLETTVGSNDASLWLFVTSTHEFLKDIDVMFQPQASPIYWSQGDPPSVHMVRSSQVILKCSQVVLMITWLAQCIACCNFPNAIYHSVIINNIDECILGDTWVTAFTGFFSPLQGAVPCAATLPSPPPPRLSANYNSCIGLQIEQILVWG